MADDSVVVMKSQPMKAGNSLEDKTEMILDLFKKLLLLKRQYTGAKGWSNFGDVMELLEYSVRELQGSYKNCGIVYGYSLIGRETH